MKAFCPKCKATLEPINVIEHCPSCQEGRPELGWPKDPLLGKVVQSYTIEKLLGSGGFGSVYQVRHNLMDDRIMAMKVLNPQIAKDPSLQEDFLRETRLLMTFDHPHVVKCYELGRLPAGDLFILMEHVAGRDLRDIIREDGPFGARATVEIGLQIASALSMAHKEGVLHRDLKPDNVLVIEEEDGPRVKVIDFGVAKILGPDTVGQQLSRVIGTPLFMAPEQFVKGGHIDPRLDIYQFGGLLFCMLTSYPPYWPGESVTGARLAIEIIQQQRARAAAYGPKPSDRVPALALGMPKLNLLIGRMLSTDPEQRPSSMDEVEAELKLLLGAGFVQQPSMGMEPTLDSLAAITEPPEPKDLSASLTQPDVLISEQKTGKPPAVTTRPLSVSTSPPPPPQKRSRGGLLGRVGVLVEVGLFAIVGLLVMIAVAAVGYALYDGVQSPAPKKPKVKKVAKAIKAPVAGKPKGFVRVKAGTFKMGSHDAEQGRKADDELQHRVTFTRDFWLQETEVTQAQWTSVMGGQPSYFQECGKRCPVERVSWFDTLSYLNTLSKKEELKPCYVLEECSGQPGLGCSEDDRLCEDRYACEVVEFEGLDCEGYRLPTEAEWEYAARAGTSTAVHLGPLEIVSSYKAPILKPIAWFGGNSRVRYDGGVACLSESDAMCGTHAVGKKQSNGWGLHDMLGNVEEWVWDRKDVYSATPATDPLGPEEGLYRSVRGGSWFKPVSANRSAARSTGSPANRYNTIGFRAARTVVKP